MFSVNEHRLAPADTAPIRTNSSTERVRLIVQAVLDLPVLCEACTATAFRGSIQRIIHVSGHGTAPAGVRQDGPSGG